MSVHHAAVTTLTIPNGQSASNALTSRGDFRDADSITIYAPAALTAVVTVQVADNENPAGGDWRDLSRGDGTDVTIAAGNAINIEVPGYKALRVLSAGAEAAQRDFKVSKSFTVV